MAATKSEISQSELQYSDICQTIIWWHFNCAIACSRRLAYHLLSKTFMKTWHLSHVYYAFDTLKLRSFAFPGNNFTNCGSWY